MASDNDKTAYEILLDFQTRLQGVGNSLADDIKKLISSTDPVILKTIMSQLPSGKSSIKSQMRAIEKMVKQIEKERKEGFDAAKKLAFDLGPEIVKKAGRTVKNVAEERGKRFKKDLSDKQVEDILNYHPIDGKSISQWFEKMRADDLSRITQAVQRASVEGMSVSRVVKAIRGTKENDYKDGVLETTRDSAKMMARTVINGVASNAMLETCVENADVIDGIKFIATLDAKTCPFCGSYDGKIWKPEEAALVKRPPLHPNCRCTVIPYVDLGEGTEGNRPAANADFDKLAEDEYNRMAREKGWDRRWDDLSQSTRLKYYYEAQKRYEKETGKPAYSQVKGNTSFKEYFENQPEEFKRSWLGKQRYELYSQGKYDPLKLGNPDSGYIVPVEKLAPVDDSDRIQAPHNKKRKNAATSSGGDSSGKTSEPLKQYHLPVGKDLDKCIAEIENSKELKEINAEIDELWRKQSRLEHSGITSNKEKRELNRIERRLQTKEDEKRNFLYDHILGEVDPNSENIKGAGQVTIPGDFVNNEKEIRKGLTFGARFLDALGIKDFDWDSIQLEITEDERESCDGTILRIKKNSETITVVHEWAHAMEELYPDLKTKIGEVFDDFTAEANGDKIPLKLKDVDPRYEEKETYYELRDKSLVPNPYCTKKDGDQTELFSMFLQELEEDPLHIMNNFREWYERMIKCCK